jgi:hypothetical protein
VIIAAHRGRVPTVADASRVGSDPLHSHLGKNLFGKPIWRRKPTIPLRIEAIMR